MENNPRYLEVAWAQRSGLYYTALNSHLRASEVQYILDDCGATALVTTPAMADVVARLDLEPCPRAARRSGAPLEGSTPTRPRSAARPTPVDDESEGREMLYSSGTTGQPKGVRKTLPATPLGDPSAAPVQIALGLATAGVGAGSVYLSPAPLYHSAPLVYSHVDAPSRGHRRGDGALRPRRLPGADRAPPGDPRPVRPDHVRPPAEAARRGARAATTSRACATSSTPPPPARWTVKRQMLEWWGPIIHEYYAGTEDIGSTWITAPRSGWPTPARWAGP